MCTSFTYKDKTQANALARTMDFAFVLDPDAVLIPRAYRWKAEVDGVERETAYAFAGLARNDKEFVFADGVNEKGLCCAALYFSGFAYYESEAARDAVNLAPHEVVFWLLSAFATTEEAIAGLSGARVVDIPIQLLGLTPPLHWIITDASGRTAVIEPVEDGIQIYDNPLGVMSNAPEFPWHVTNIRNYIGVNPNPTKPLVLDGVSFTQFGQGSGTFGLPGDYTPPSRFLRVLFGKKTALASENEADAMTAIVHLLSTVDIPKGSVATDHGVDYTQHSSIMFCETGRYCFRTYDNSQICMIDLFAHDLDAQEPYVWDIPKEQHVQVVGE
ncbi:choloylglycine hydrolase family protein [Raoultibacter phocaeensis]|uniref:choloylglycine hydrolase family protein n=1 Tax=Raoultibacter phocaeensis TaxID=2479841 RepID=UPI00111BA460|nr:choloylglycine hydrolase family protein [Raoultibacter phocaeensis]